MLAKIISIISSLTLLSRFLGYLRDLLIAKVLGAGLISDCFFIAFKIPNLFRRLFAEGSMNAAFIPVVSGIRKNYGKESADIFFSKIFSLLLVVLFFFLIIIEIFTPIVISIIAPGFIENKFKYSLTIDYSRLTFPFLIFICLTSLIGAYLNTLGKFASMAITPIILNLTLIFTLIILFRNGDQVFISYYLSLSISIAGIIQLIWMIINLKKSNVNFQFTLVNKKPIKLHENKFYKLLAPAIIGNGVYQLNLLIDMILASTLPDGSISYLYYADRVNQLPLGVLGIAISTALLPVLSKYVKMKDKKKSTQTLSNALHFGLIFSIPSFIGIFILSNQIIMFLFFRGEFTLSDVELTSYALIALSLGLPAFIMIKILVVPFFAMEDTKTPLKISLFSIAINLTLNLILIDKYQHVGLAISTSFAAWVNALTLFVVLKGKQVKFERILLSTLFKVIIASLIMGIAINFMLNSFGKDIINLNFFEITNVNLILIIFCAILIYFSCLFMMGIKNFNLRK